MKIIKKKKKKGGSVSRNSQLCPEKTSSNTPAGVDTTVSVRLQLQFCERNLEKPRIIDSERCPEFELRDLAALETNF